MTVASLSPDDSGAVRGGGTEEAAQGKSFQNLLVALGRLRQEDHLGFEASLAYTE